MLVMLVVMLLVGALLGAGFGIPQVFGLLALPFVVLLLPFALLLWIPFMLLKFTLPVTFTGLATVMSEPLLARLPPTSVSVPEPNAPPF